MARPINQNSERSIAARLGFTRAKIREMKRAGVDFDNPESVNKHERNSQRFEVDGSETKTKTETKTESDQLVTAENLDIEVEKLRVQLLTAKEKRDAETIEIKIRSLGRIQAILVEQGKYILAADAEAEGMRFGLAAKHMWEEIEDSLPPMLEGLSALQMKTKLREFGAARILELHEFFSE